MEINKKMIPCDCENASCKEFASCCFVATEVVRVTSGEDDPVHLMFVGQGAGKDEDINMNPKNTLRQPFVGKAGAYLRNMIKFLWDNSVFVNVAISNSVRFHPRDGLGKDRAPTDDELGGCICLLNRDIELIKPKALVSLGASTSNALAPATIGLSMGKTIGTSYIYKGIKVIPLYHPSFLTRCYGKFTPGQRGEYHVKCVNILKDTALDALGQGI